MLMRRRKVYQLLLLFNSDDLKGFQHFLSNPFFSSSTTIITFFKLWKKWLNAYPEGFDCTVEEFLEGSGINPRRMDKLSSKLYALASNYLALIAFQKNPETQDEMLLSAIASRDSGSKSTIGLFERLQSKVEGEKEGPLKIQKALKLKLMMAEALIKTRGTRTLWKEDFQDLQDLLDRYYRLQKLKLLAASANARNIFNHEEENTEAVFPNALPSEFSKIPHSPISKAYTLSIQMFQVKEGKSHFLELLQLLGDEAHHFAASEGIELYGYALNFSIQSTNQGKLEYLNFASTLYQQLIENKLILHNGEILPQQFKNIVALHCRLGMLEWVASFIENYGELLPVESQAFALLYNRSILAFYQKDFSHAIVHLKEIIATYPEDVFYGLDARTVLWKSFWEHLPHLSLEEVDEMHRLYDAFRLFIERNEKISEAHKHHYQNFIRVFKRFIDIQEHQPILQKDIRELRELVMTMVSGPHQGWFLEKIDKILANI